MSVQVTRGERGFLRRELHIALDGQTHHVVWDGRGMGYEAVIVDGVPLRRHSVLWFVPRFPFEIAGRSAHLDVRVTPWFTVRLDLYLDDELVYTDRPIRPKTF